MKPNFALSLSFEGIRLLHRAAGGWRRIGEVSVSTADLAGALSALRDAASDLTEGALRTTLIIPDDQIKYLTLDTGDVGDDARRAAAETALDGATPYPVSALVFDICADGTQTHVAAVARETLAEAEAFASEHGFNPVCTVAAPKDAAFLGAPWFGPTAAAQTLLGAGETVEPDPVRVVMVGDVASDAAPEMPPEVKDTAPVAEATSDEAPTGAAPEPNTTTATTPPKADETAPAVEEAPEPEGAQEEGLTEAPAPSARTLPTEPGFASRRGGDVPALPTPLGGVTRDASDLAAPAPTPLRDAVVAAANPAKARPSRRSGAFLSRRQAPRPDAQGGKATEAQRLTIFGARGAETTGRARRATRAAALAAIVGISVAATSYAALTYGGMVTDLFKRDRTLASTLPENAEAALAEDVGATTDPEPQDDAGVAVASLNEGLTDGLSEEDAAVLDALRDPLPEPQAPEALDAAQLEARYAVTGIWPKAPEVPSPPGLILLEDFYLTSVDPVSPALDAVALPQMASLRTDEGLPEVADPLAPGIDVPRDAQGRVLPTPEGTLSPDGYTVYSGRPALIPPNTPSRTQTAEPPAEPQDQLIGTRPRARPTDLVEQNERATLGGLSRSELATFRPRLRPQAPQELLQDPEAAPEAEAEALAALPPAAPTLRPSARPRNFDRIVARTERSTNRGSTVGTAVASVAPRAVTPSIPSSASVTREATVRNAINLRRVNLIGVYGTPSDRRALVRLANGRYQKVQVGDRFDGGRVSAIGDSELRYQKGGRNVVLKMPSG